VPLLYRHDGVRSKPNRVCAFGLLLVAVALVPLAYASPPDPVWIAGIYDCADLDDTIEAIISAIWLVGDSSVLSMLAGPTGRAVAHVQPPPVIPAVFSPFQIRSPPPTA